MVAVLAAALCAAAVPGRCESLAACLELGVRGSRTARQLTAEKERQRALLGASRTEFAPRVTVTRDTSDRRLVQITDRLANQTEVRASIAEDGGGARSETVNFSQALFVHNAAELERARIGWRIACLQYDQSLEEYKFSVIRKFYDVLRSRERLRTLEESVDRWAKALTFAKVKFDLGATTKIDLLNTRVNQGNAETAMLAEQQVLAGGLDELKDLVGLEMTAPLTLEASIGFSPLATEPNRWVRREVGLARLRLDSARVLLRDAEERSRPDIRLDTTYRSTRGTSLLINGVLTQPGDSELVGALTWNVQLGRRTAEFDLDRLRQDVASARIALEQAGVTVEREKREFMRNVSLKERAIRTAQESLDQARESYDFSLDAFQRGLVTSLDLRDSQDKLTRAREVHTSLLIDYKLLGREYVKVFGGTL